MIINFISFGNKKENLDLALKHKIIGSEFTTFESYIKKDSTVLLHCQGKIWAVTKVTSDCFEEKTPIWEDKLYPFRFKIKLNELLHPPVDIKEKGINDLMRNEYGRGWGFSFLFAPKPISSPIAQKIIDIVFSDN